ncbi:MAG: hypothetical protein QNJ94_23545 [Alphaproteobacteria bacterium]|nr:hypothetical protein [Alphaproteobacteria bacterium]
MKQRFSALAAVLAATTLLSGPALAGPKVSTPQISVPQAALSSTAIGKALPKQALPSRLGLSVRRLGNVARVRAVGVGRGASGAIGRGLNARTARLGQVMREANQARAFQRLEGINRQLDLDTAMGLVRDDHAPRGPDGFTTSTPPVGADGPLDPFAKFEENGPANANGNDLALLDALRSGEDPGAVGPSVGNYNPGASGDPNQTTQTIQNPGQTLNDPRGLAGQDSGGGGGGQGDGNTTTFQVWEEREDAKGWVVTTTEYNQDGGRGIVTTTETLDSEGELIDSVTLIEKGDTRTTVSTAYSDGNPLNTYWETVDAEGNTLGTTITEHKDLTRNPAPIDGASDPGAPIFCIGPCKPKDKPSTMDMLGQPGMHEAQRGHIGNARFLFEAVTDPAPVDAAMGMIESADMGTASPQAHGAEPANRDRPGGGITEYTPGDDVPDIDPDEPTR